MTDHIEPIALKAGDTRVLINGRKCKEDFRVIAEVEYQHLRATLTASLAREAAAFEAAAGTCQQEAENSVNNGFPERERGLEIAAQSILALTPADAQAALDRMIGDAVKVARAEDAGKLRAVAAILSVSGDVQIRLPATSELVALWEIANDLRSMMGEES